MKNSTLLLLLTITAPLYAQTVHELNEIEVAEVRGNKDEKTFLETNDSVTTLKPKSLNRSDLPNSLRLLNGLGNVQVQEDRTGPSFSIRGISDMGVTGFQKDNLATILVDDVFQTTLAVRAGIFENWDLELIEVRRGAQSTDQGVNSLAGNILLYHHAPQFVDEGQAKVTVGNYGRYEGAVVVNKAISERLASRTAINYEQTDGYIENVTTDNENWGENKKQHLVQDFLYKVSEKDDLRLNLKLLRNHRGGGYVQGDFKDYQVTEDQDYKEISNAYQASLYYNHRFSKELWNKMIFAATRATSTARTDEDGQATNIAGVRNINDKDYFLSFENQLKYHSGKVRNLLGIHTHKYYLNNFYDFNLIYAAPSSTTPVTQENNKERFTYAIFDTFTYDFTTKHSLILGGRLDVVKNDFGVDIQAGPPLAGFSGLQEDSSTNTVFLPKIGYNYKLTNFSSLGATYSQGYRTGGISVNRAELSTNEYGPERTHNYELSYKYLKEKTLIAANLFYTKWNDQQVELNFGSFNTRVENAAESELYGAEFEISQEFKNQDSVRFNLGYVKTHFLSFNNNGDSFTGNAFPDSAPLTGQLSYWKFLTERWMLILVTRYVSESYSDVENERWSPEQFYMDINTQYNFDQYLLEFYVRNIFDQRYRILNGTSRTATYPASYHRVSAPREFGARLNYYW